jgi:hypothetical protein
MIPLEVTHAWWRRFLAKRNPGIARHAAGSAFGRVLHKDDASTTMISPDRRGENVFPRRDQDHDRAGALNVRDFVRVARRDVLLVDLKSSWVNSRARIKASG